jgi:single-stranded DNA-binding protein
MDQQEQEKETHWMDCEVWGDTARQLIEHVSKANTKP